MRSLVGRPSHTLFDASTPGDITWFRLHNLNYNPMNPRRQTLSTPQTNMKQLPKQNGWGSAPVEEKMSCGAWWGGTPTQPTTP